MGLVVLRPQEHFAARRTPRQRRVRSLVFALIISMLGDETTPSGGDHHAPGDPGGRLAPRQVLQEPQQIVAIR